MSHYSFEVDYLFVSFQDLLDKVAQEIGEPIEADHDPIHDQVGYRARVNFQLTLIFISGSRH